MTAAAEHQPLRRLHRRSRAPWRARSALRGWWSRVFRVYGDVLINMFRGVLCSEKLLSAAVSLPFSYRLNAPASRVVVGPCVTKCNLAWPAVIKSRASLLPVEPRYMWLHVYAKENPTRNIYRLCYLLHRFTSYSNPIVMSRQTSLPGNASQTAHVYKCNAYAKKHVKRKEMNHRSDAPTMASFLPPRCSPTQQSTLPSWKAVDLHQSGKLVES